MNARSVLSLMPSCRPALVAALLVLSCAWPIRVGAQQAAGAHGDLWGDLVLPGDIAAARNRATLGSGTGRLDAAFLIDFTRRFGDSGAALAIARLDAHNRAIAAAFPSVTYALPLPLPAFWAGEMTSGDATPAAVVLRTRTTLLTYHGLMALDDASLAVLSTMPPVVRWIADTDGAAAAFATAARSIRLAGGKVRVPGGDDAAPVWMRLVGNDGTSPERFLRELLGRDRGRLAYFYDAISSLSPERQRFVLGAHLPQAERPAFVQRIYRAFSTVDPEWQPGIRPFHRPDFDGLVALVTVDVGPDGTVGPDWWPSLFDRVIRAGPWPSNSQAAPAPSPADAAWLFEWTFAERGDARRRFAALRFAQRIFATTPRERAPQVEAALRGVIDTPALLLAAERMGVRDPDLLAALARAAHDASNHGDVDAIGRWQASLALLEQAQRRAAWPSARLTPLLLSWAAAVPTRETGSGPVLAWVVETLVPALVDDVGPPEGIEAAFITAATRADHAPLVEWEGLVYTTSAARAAATSAQAIRSADNALDLHHLVEVQGALTALGRDTAAGTAVETLRAIFDEIEMLPDAGTLDAGLRRRARRALDDLAPAPSSPGRSVRIDRALFDLTDAIADRVVPPLVYALALAPTTETGLYSSLWHRHSLVPSGRVDGSGTGDARPGWHLARNAGEGGGLGLAGSYLGLDVALAASQLVRVISGTPPVQQVVSEADRSALSEALVVPPMQDESDVVARALAALAEGRRRTLAWRQQPPSRHDLAAQLMSAGIDPWRGNTLAWQVARSGPDALDALTPGELSWLGTAESVTPAAWSGSSRLVDGCLCRARHGRVDPELLRGRQLGVRALRTLDPALRLAELLASANLDPSLVPTLLPMALQDWLDRAESTWMDDEDAFSSWPGTLTAARLDEYLLEAVATGRLAPPAVEAQP